MYTITQLDEHLIGMGHMGTLNKVRNKYAMYERAASKFLLKCKPLETIRTQALASAIWDDIFNYALPSDFNALIDLIPQDNRTNWDRSYRTLAGEFDRLKAIREKTLSIEGSDGTKTIRINWRSRQSKTLNAMDSLTANGTWSAVATASGLKATTIFKVTGSASIEFDLAASGDGIQNTTMTQVDLTDESTIADVFAWVYLSTVPTSISAIWGNDLTTKYWTSVAQTTQADGTAFKVGWNLVKFPWSTATQTGTVAPATIDSFKLTVASSVAIANIRVDSIVFAIGRNFDIKYYSKYLFKNSVGTYISQPTSSDDSVTIGNDSLPLYLFELLKDMAHQLEGTDSAFDIDYAKGELKELYPLFKDENPDQRTKATTSYGSMARFGRRRTW